MWWHKLKIIGGIVFLLIFAGCSAVTIDELDEMISETSREISALKSTEAHAGMMAHLEAQVKGVHGRTEVLKDGAEELQRELNKADRLLQEAMANMEVALRRFPPQS